MRRNWIMALALAASFTPGLAAADAYDAMRERWQARLTGGPALDREAPEMAAKLEAQAASAQRHLARMQGTRDSAALWDDIADFSNPKGLLASATVTSNAVRLAQMAQAYATPGTAAYRDAALGQGIAAGLDWLVRKHYGVGHKQVGNWWDWQIGAPLQLLNVLSLAGDAVPAELLQRSLAAVNWYVPDARYKTRPDGSLNRQHIETGANLLDKALVAILSGVLGKEGERIAAGRDAIGATLEYVEQGDGFYRDNSFIQHNWLSYTGSYGVVALADYARLLYVLGGSPWAYNDPRASRIFLWAREAFAPLVVDGAMPDAFRGRKIASRLHHDHVVGRGTAASLALLAESAPPADAAALRATVKGWMARDRTFGNYLGAADASGVGSLPPYEMSLLRAIAADPAIPAAAEAPGARIYASMDRAILRGPSFAAVLSLTSPRTSSFEAGNGENLLGWWTGMGMLALYDADQAQFGPDYWATVDSMRLPGTTTDRYAPGRPKEWEQYPNTEAWVGGASIGRFAAIGMAFSMRQVTGSPLQGRKSWFLLDDRILALGSGIGAGKGAVETIVENRRLSDAGARLLVDGKPLANGSKAHARWAHLRDEKSGSSIGYVFPQGSALQAERSERSGNWRALNEQAGTQEYRHSYQLLSIPQHKPQYAYMLLPNSSAAATRAAAAQPGVRIEANDAQAAAVSVPQRGIYAANLWQAGSAPRAGKAYVWSSAPAAVVLASEGGKLRLAVAEPTQRAAVLELAIAQAVSAVGQLPSGVQVLETAPRLRLRIDTSKSAGSAVEVWFFVQKPAIVLEQKS